jgi:mRNA interferase MazF
VRIDRYGVYWVSLDPVEGSEIAKTRPAVVVSDDEMNEHLGTVVVCPISSRIHPLWPSRVQAKVGGKPAEIAVDQIWAIAKSRLGRRIGTLAPGPAAAVRHLITEMYGVLSVSGP